VLRGSGGSYRPRSVGRTHDFKYEREPQLKAPKEIETHYLREKEIPEAPANPYRPGVNVDQIGKTVSEKIQKYLADQTERQSETTDYEVHSNMLGAETESDFVIPELPSAAIEGMDDKLDLTVEAVEPITENPVEDPIEPSLQSGPELYESGELPVRELELLLAELDATPLETKLDQKSEKVEDAERSL